jgi:hypothetical protein
MPEFREPSRLTGWLSFFAPHHNTLIINRWRLFLDEGTSQGRKMAGWKAKILTFVSLQEIKIQLLTPAVGLTYYPH